jgi:hypothetical protein
MHTLSRFVISPLLLCALFFTVSANAGTGHDHGHGEAHDHARPAITAEKATQNALELIKRLVKKEKLAQSWLQAKAVKTEKKMFKKGPEWVVLYNNKEIKDAKKQNLYVFYSLKGQYIAANHSGI